MLLAVTAASTVAQSIPSLATEQWREDLRYMAEQMEAVHNDLYHTISEEAFAAAVEDLHDRIPQLDDHEVIVGLARVVAMVGDGHTGLWIGPNSPTGFRQYPLRLYLFDEGLYVQVAEGDAPIVGGRVVQIGDVEVDEAIEQASALAPRDNEMQVRGAVPTLLAVPEVLHALGIVEDMERGTFVVEGPDGQRHTAVLTPQPAEPALAQWAVEPAADLFERGYTGVRERDPAATSLYLRETRRVNSVTYLPETGTVYAQVNASANAEGESLAAFAERVYALVDERRPERLVIDLRQNGGGNNQLNLPLVHGLIERPWLNRPERAFVLIGRHTFSAASHLVTALEIHTNATFVGEPTGASPNHYGDAPSIELPHSGLVVQASALYWQNSQPWDRRPWTPPDVSVPVTFDAYASNRDPAMEAVLAFKPQPPLGEQLREAVAQGATVEQLTETYRAFAADPRNAYANVTGALNGLGYALLGQERTEEAIAVFRLNVAEHPYYANGYDSLGEALAVAGQTGEAIAAYERALALDPEGRTGANARVQIDRLRRE